MHRLRSRRRDDRGAAAVEFALVMLPLMYLLFGLIQYGLYFWSMQAGSNATSDAVRRVVVGDCQDSTQLKAYVVSRLGAASVNSSTVTVTPSYQKVDSTGAYVADTAPGSVGGKVTIAVTFDSMNLRFPLIPVPNNGTITRTISGRIEDTVASGTACS